jgi:hypothetical protein
MASSIGCPAGTHWDEACCCCVDNGIQEPFQTLYRLASQVTYAAIRRVFAAPPKERAEKLKSSISILKAALKKLTEERTKGY